MSQYVRTSIVGMDASEHTTKTDAEIVQATLQNPDMFGVLIARYSDKLLRFIRRITAVNTHEAEDILQETFIKAYTNLRDFDQSLSFSSWIYRIARNETISQHRKAKARPHGNSIEVDDTVFANFASDHDVAAIVEATLQKEQLKEALASIDQKYRDVLVLKYFEGLSYNEISDVIKKPPGTVATLLNRAKKHLKKEIDKRYAR